MPEEFGTSTTSSYIYSVCANYTAAEQDKQVTLIGNPYMFTARRYDLETGLYYYRARYFNPYIGRFLQMDPAKQGMNWYAYCGNNSLNCTDPMGLRPIPTETYEVDIPLRTIWHEPFFIATIDGHNEKWENKKLVQAFLDDAQFSSLFPDIRLIYAHYNEEKEEFHCIFSYPAIRQYARLKMYIEEKVPRVPILTVQTGLIFKSKTLIVDWRLAGMMNDPNYRGLMTATGSGGFWAEHMAAEFGVAGIGAGLPLLQE